MTIIILKIFWLFKRKNSFWTSYSRRLTKDSKIRDNRRTKFYCLNQNSWRYWLVESETAKVARSVGGSHCSSYKYSSKDTHLASRSREPIKSKECSWASELHSWVLSSNIAPIHFIFLTIKMKKLSVSIDRIQKNSNRLVVTLNSNDCAACLS